MHSLIKEILQNFMHIPLYAGLAFFLVLALRQFISGIYPYIYTLIIGISVACADEYLQSFAPGRTV
ncbi:MAG: VanZ family protein [Candidatus Omnitrophica bacterium]|nr:VanZ family protein [Candidatus Omnitrophota bacterium]